ncbi:hypothetical protein FRC12_000757 [Ceratobasidium sp. 428]|nr:hypothetical protein FRC12_000757 [Ceratobasidium sp. 428]
MVKQDADLLDWSVRDQYDRLIGESLQKVGYTFPSPVIVIIDALDECEDDEGIDQMLNRLINPKSNLPIKFLVTSRREHRIAHHMRTKAHRWQFEEFCIDDVSTAIARKDVEVHLELKLGPINPSTHDIEQLIKQSGALFRHAATLVQYILGDDDSEATNRMKQLLNVSSEGDDPHQLDTMYDAILEATLHLDYFSDLELTEVTRVLHAAVWSQGSLTKDELLFGLPSIRQGFSLDQALSALQLILQVSDLNGRVTASTIQYLRWRALI